MTSVGKTTAARGNTKGRPRTSRREPMGIKSVETALEVLNAFLDQDGRVSLTELSRTTGIATSKLHRYLVSLGRHGMIVQNGPLGTYDLGPAARRLGSVALTRFDGFQLIDEEAQALSDRRDAGVFIYVWSDSGPVMVRNHLTRGTGVSLKVGSTLPLLISGCGPVFLACLPKSWTEPVVSAERVGGEVVPWDDARKIADKARCELDERGAYWAEQGIMPGVPVCAAPIFEAQGRLHSVVGVSFINKRLDDADKAQIIADVADTAKRLSQAFGHS